MSSGSTRDTIRTRILELSDEGGRICRTELQCFSKLDAGEDIDPGSFVRGRTDYQAWYSEALRLVEQLLPDRYEEFQALYRPGKRNSKELDPISFTITDYLQGVEQCDGLGEREFDPSVIFAVKFRQQIDILKSAVPRLDSILSDIEGVIQARLFDDELDAARDLKSKGHSRAAGALAGVTLEAHLSHVAASHGIKTKKNASIADLNDALKAAGVLSLPTWRLIQRLADIRNLCVHRKKDDPTDAEVSDLLGGVAKITAEVF